MRVAKVILIFLIKNLHISFFCYIFVQDLKVKPKSSSFMEKKIERISNEIEALTKRLNNLNEKMAGVRFIDFVRSFGSDIILLEKKIEILTIVRNSLQTNPTQDMFDRMYGYVCRMAMTEVGFASGAFTHSVDALCNNAVKEIYDFLTYIE